PSGGGSTARAAGESAKQVSKNGIRKDTDRTGNRLIGFVGGTFVFIRIVSLPRWVKCATVGPERGKRLSGVAPSPRFRTWFPLGLPNLSPAWQDKNRTPVAHARYGVARCFSAASNASIRCFCPASDPSSASTLRCSLRNSLSNIAFTASYRTLYGLPS